MFHEDNVSRFYFLLDVEEFAQVCCGMRRNTWVHYASHILISKCDIHSAIIYYDPPVTSALSLLKKLFLFNVSSVLIGLFCSLFKIFQVCFCTNQHSDLSSVRYGDSRDDFNQWVALNDFIFPFSHRFSPNSIFETIQSETMEYKYLRKY